MKTITSIYPGEWQTPANLSFLSRSTLASATAKPDAPIGRNRLRRTVQYMLAGSLLASGAANAALQDFGGVSDNIGTGVTPATILNWPAWYRDNNGLALGLCKSQAASPDPGAAGAPMCFPVGPTTVNPAGFPGNIGDEIFYTNLNANISNGGIELRYVSALEAAYANGNGTPVKGDEMVFARIRFVMSVNSAACAGDYTIIHPWGTSTFTDVPEGPRALFETADVGLTPLDFAGSLQGSIGPFLHWDGDGDEIPLPRTVVTGLQVGAEEFVGDPNVAHSYTGSPFIETLPDGITPRYFLLDGRPQHQNYLKVIAPPGCDIGGTPAPAGEGINVQKEPLGFLLGQVWTDPIATPTKITQAEFTRNASATTVDVWAKTDSTPVQTLFVTGNKLQGVEMTPVIVNGTHTGEHQAHIVLPGDAILPPIIDVVNATSIPLVKATSALTDIIYVSKAEYNPANGNLCVSAHSSDDQALTLTSDAAPLIATLDASVKPACPAVGTDLTALVTYPLENRAPEKVQVTSQLSGKATKAVTVLANTPDNTTTLVAAPDVFLNVPGDGAQVLNVGANDLSSGEIFIVDQPGIPGVNLDGQPTTVIVGTATGSLTGGTVTFTANPGAAGTATFSYFIRNGVDVSNLVNATVDIQFVAAAPTGNPDNFAVLRTNNTPGFTANVIANDVAGIGTTLDPASVVISSQGSRGVATANADGTVTYQPNIGATAGTDTFFYTVANTAGTVSSPVRVDVVVEGSLESVSINRNKYSAGRWDLRMTSTWFGAPLTSTGSCWLVRVGNTTLPVPRLIGTIALDATGASQIQVLGNKAYNAANYDPAVDVPTIPNGNYTIRCGTSNAVTPLPAASNQTADNTTSAK